MANYVRIEYYASLERPVARPMNLLGGVTLVAAATATAAGSQPQVPANDFGGPVYAYIAADAATYVSIGANPDPTVDPGRLLIRAADPPMVINVLPGHKVSTILSADIA